MEIINNSLSNLDKQLQKNIKDLQNEYQKAILDTSKYYFNSYTDFDISLIEYFPDIKNTPRILPENHRYNPKMVIEYDKDRNPVKILREGDWDTDIGYLQNRKVMYEIELIQCWDKEVVETIENIDICNFKEFMSDKDFWNKLINKTLYKSISRYNFFNIRFKDTECTDIQIKVDLKYKVEGIWKFKLEVDNYLNLKSNICINGFTTQNIYFCFNKIPFPDFAFLTNNRLQRLVISGENNILNYRHKDTILSKDKEEEILNKSKFIVPENYEEVYKYFDNFRKLANWYIEGLKEEKNKIINLEKQITQDKEKIKKLENELKQKDVLLEKYKSLVN
jgi:hypothetical protein